MRSVLQRSDALNFALVAHVDVGLGGPHIHVAGHGADDLKRDAAIGEHRAERVAQGVCGAAILAYAGSGGVLGDDITDGARGERRRDSRAGGLSMSPDVSVNLHNVWTVMPKLLEFLNDAAASIVDELLERR
jgi:hypothetical protein